MKLLVPVASILLFSNSIVSALPQDYEPAQNVPAVVLHAPYPQPTAAELSRARELRAVLADDLRQARTDVDAGSISKAVALFADAKKTQAAIDSAEHSQPRTRFFEVESLIVQKQYPEAIALLERSHKDASYEAWLTILYGNLFDTAKARRAFHRAFYKNGKLDAGYWLDKFMSVNGETDGAMQVAARIYAEEHLDGDGASRVYDRVEILKDAESFSPGNPHLEYLIGKLYFGVRDYKDALPHLESAMSGLKPYGEQEDCEASVRAGHQRLAGGEGAG